jgi:hypothetical protein
MRITIITANTAVLLWLQINAIKITALWLILIPHVLTV